MNERDAGMAIRRASLDLGAIAHLSSPGAADIVLAQTPPANAEGVDKPEVSLLLSQPESASPRAYVMPSLVGMSYSAASAKMREMDLRVYAIVPQPVPLAVDPSAPAGTPPPAPVATIPAGVVLSQTPAAGMRVSAADTARVKMSAAAVAAPTAPPSSTTVAPATGVGVPRPPAPVIRRPAAIPSLGR
jgi:beta-lactam-binding protein with PASTA domain